MWGFPGLFQSESLTEMSDWTPRTAQIHGSQRAPAFRSSRRRRGSPPDVPPGAAIRPGAPPGLISRICLYRRCSQRVLFPLLSFLFLFLSLLFPLPSHRY